MILILGGTTEGRIAVETIDEAGRPFFYSTRQGDQDIVLHNGLRLQGAMDADDMARFCREHDIRLLVDAAHPFASQLHRTVALTAEQLSIPVVRLERRYPPRDPSICWCADYAEAIARIRQAKVGLLLALTGVQTIGKLSPLWKDDGLPCHFRILPREASRKLAIGQGFPIDHLHYYQAGQTDDQLMRSLRPDAILTKESGLTGGFLEKVNAAQALGIRVFAVCRPPMPAGFHTVNGPHGLRRAIEHLLPEYFALHSGLTTGTCATASALSAISRILASWPTELPAIQIEKEEQEKGQDLVAGQSKTNPDSTIGVALPNGETITVDVEPANQPPRIEVRDGQIMAEASASVVKDAGDDPDITNGMTVCARVRLTYKVEKGQDLEASERKAGYIPTDEPDIQLTAGEGIGIVTLPGLGLPVGGPAINEVPRRMIVSNVIYRLKQSGLPVDHCRVDICLSVPGGEEAAKRTFNPRIGVVGGISIIGTSGIVHPFSSDAFVSSIRKSMSVARATGSPLVVINSGAKSEKYLRALFPELPLQAFVHYGNFIGETLKIASEAQVPEVVMGLMIGKAVKLAEGHLDTHSKHATMNLPFVCGLAYEAGCSAASLQRIGQISMAREIWGILSADETQSFCRVLIRHCMEHCAPLLPDGRLRILIITDDGRVPVR